jgi:hypothetical protein
MPDWGDWLYEIEEDRKSRIRIKPLRTGLLNFIGGIFYRLNILQK